MVGQHGENLGFLLSLPRSGSTLLSVMLDNHSEIASPTEPWIMLALQQLAHVDIRHPANAQSVGKAIRDFTAGEAGLAAARAAACTLYDHALNGKTLLIDKTPRYYLILDYINQIFPQAKYLWLVRNPFAIAASYKTTWNVDLPDLIANRVDDSNVFDFVLGLETLEAFAGTMGKAVHRIQYEALVTDPSGIMAGVLEFLGFPPADMEKLTDLSHQKRTADSFGDPKILSTTAPHTRSIDGWEALFSPAELQTLFDAVGRERLERLGYGDTVQRLMALGVEDRGQAPVHALLEHVSSLLAIRYNDIERVTTHGIPLSHHIQERARYVVAGDDAWDARYADRATLDQTLAFIAQERADYSRQHALQAEEIAKRDLMVKERDEEIGNRGRHIAMQDERIAQLIAERDKAIHERDTLQQAIHKQDEALVMIEENRSALRTALRERDEQIAALMNSPSWKLTAPLRALSGSNKPK
ncbi:hypothetical protein M2352_005230 [Azospirillum fermentarium]|uniref:sulfotransferase family protein n=1 Tax=Azospirillum fermentarium TaxID=1233114 RepID=UPI002225D831|nr:sulfotransferase [Azospirillum fermentarium]MCW2249547.1 hypothetical protein [Azospirillum fermentarium]